MVILITLLLFTGPGAALFANSVSFTPTDSSKEWIIADIGQYNELRIIATNTSTGLPVPNAEVTFTVDNPGLGAVTPAIVTTDTSGKATATFYVNATKPTSGTARITADVKSSDGAAIFHTVPSPYWDQKIDHNVPYSAIFTYNYLGSVESEMPVKVSLYDRWNNRIDKRYELEKALPVHNITLHVNGPSPPNNCGFTNYSLAHDHTFDLDANGEVGVGITPATKPGWHYILMDPFGSIPEQMARFITVADGVPFTMVQSFSPDGEPYPTVLADGSSKFTFYYTLYDKYGNPTQNQDVRISSSAGEEYINKSLENGQVWSTYGPKSFTGLFTITATPLTNATLSLSKVVRFYNTSPTGLSLSANPSSMPSKDANPAIYALIVAKVEDIMGNGVAGETVTFSISGVTNNPASAGTTTAYVAPSLSATSAVSDANGYATVKLYPATYATATQPGYQQIVSGNAIVTANWKGIEKDEPVVWKNYPYLSAVVDVNPKQVKVGETVNVSIKLNGDGWALYRYPIDVMLVMDKSGSMAWSTSGATSPPATQSRIFIANTSAINFINKMNPSSDKAGLWSFSSAGGNPTVDAGLQSPYGPVITKSKALIAGGATATREGVKQAIDYMVANPNGNSKAVRAIITMTDGEFNNEGSIIAHGTGWQVGSDGYEFSGSALEPENFRYYPGRGGTVATTVDACETCASGYYSNGNGKCCNAWNDCYRPSSRPSWCSAKAAVCTDGEFTEQNLSIYAKNNNIRLYFIFFASTPSATAANQLKTAADATGGYYQAVTTAAELDDAYTKIAGDLITEAGVNTAVTADFGQVIVNDVITGDPVFDYVGDPVIATDSPTNPPGSTMLDKYHKTPFGVIDKHLVPGIDVITGNPFSGTGPIITNQTKYWADHNRQLAFNVGTVNVNETWAADFRFRVLKEGNIMVFGPSSNIHFDNGAAGASDLKLPNLSLYSSLNPLNVGVTGKTLSIVGLARSDGLPSDVVKGTLPISWNTVYNGAQTITEEVSYIYNDQPPITFDKKILNPATDLGTPQSAILDTDKLPPGGYKIMVKAYTADAMDTQMCGPYSYTTQDRAFIKLE